MRSLRKRNKGELTLSLYVYRKNIRVNCFLNNTLRVSRTKELLSLKSMRLVKLKKFLRSARKGQGKD